MPESADEVVETPDPAIRTHLGWAVASAMLCFLPTGIVALIYGLRTQRAVAEGRLDDAVRASRVGKRWLILTVVVGLLIYVCLTVVFVLLGAFSK
jgi:hypothetical protein